MKHTEKQEILLESGTNEMEIIEFYVGRQPMGINVQKLKEIISFDRTALTVVPDSPPAMLGVLMMRGTTIPLIDLKQHLKQRPEKGQENAGVDAKPVVLVCEFNHSINGFLVDGVNQIHRVSWQDLQPLASIIEQFRPRFTGSIHIDDREILVLDLEYIIGEFDPDSVLGSHQDADDTAESVSPLELRREKKILMAEDSTLIRSNLETVLKDAGFSGIETFHDGESCYQRILQLKQQAEDLGEPVSKHLNMLISDIEMPKMDGLTLCRKIKEEHGWTEVSVLLFSSLINPPMEVKCDSVGADGYASKPEVSKLIKLMDEFLGIK